MQCVPNRNAVNAFPSQTVYWKHESGELALNVSIINLVTGWPCFHFALAHFLPVGAQRRALALHVTFHHGPTGVWVRVGIQFLKESIHWIASAVVRVDGIRAIGIIATVITSFCVFFRAPLLTLAF